MTMETNETDRLLQTCLDLIRNGHLSMEEVLALYPEHVEEFRPRLEAMLWLTQATPLFEPRPGFVHASQRRLVERIKQESAVQTGVPVAPAVSLGFFAWLSNFFGQKRFAVQFAVVLVLIIALFVSSTGVALAAQDTIPGDNLYPVKLAVENLQLAVTTSAAGEARLRTDFAKRRLLEIQSLVLEGRYQYIPSVVENFEMQVTH